MLNGYIKLVLFLLFIDVQFAESITRQEFLKRTISANNLENVFVNDMERNSPIQTRAVIGLPSISSEAGSDFNSNSNQNKKLASMMNANVFSVRPKLRRLVNTMIRLRTF